MSTKKIKKIINQLQKRYEKNTSFMQQNLPDFYINLFSIKGNLKTEIEVDKFTGKLNLKVNDKYMFEKNKLFSIYQQQFEDFKKNPGLIVALISENIPEDIDTLNHSYLRKMISFEELPKEKNQIVFDGKLIPYIVVFGTGLGYHIEWLIENYDVMHMHIIDLDIELFKPSLYTIDWEKVLKYFQEPYRSISFTIGVTDPVIVAKEIIMKIWSIHPTFGVLTYVYEHYENDSINIIKDYLKQKFLDVLRGYGFFDDEIWAVEHTVGNIKNSIPVYYGDHKVPEENDIPAFIVASGPSLDNSMEYIKRNKEKAVIFSCGTAINKLLDEGIVPDFHIEIERTKSTYEKLMFKYDKDLFKDVFIVAANNVYPDVFKLTPRSAMFLKGDDTGTLFFEEIPNIERLSSTNPTVTNGAFALCSNMGFKEIYLFGTDLGYINPKKHHSSGTVYDDKNFMYYKDEFPSHIKVKGNFREFVYTEDIFMYSKNKLEEQIKNYQGIKVYNTSDGAFIEGSIPLNISLLKDFKKEKHQLVYFLKQNFRDDYIKLIDIEHKVSEFKKSSKLYIDEFIKLHSQLLKASNLKELLKLFYDINQFIINLPVHYQVLFRGSIWQFNMYMYTLYLYIQNDEIKDRFKNWALGISLNFLQECKKVIDKI